MTKTNFDNLQIRVKNILICLLFSFNIFFWGINFDFIQLRFVIFLLIFPILLNLNRIKLSKFLKYFLISLILLLHLFFQTNKFQYNYLPSIFGFFFILIILDNYKFFFLNNLHKIIYLLYDYNI
jgi:hypothetical protein